MSALVAALHPDRLSRFIAVAREEGIGLAFRKARQKLSHLRTGQVPSSLGHAASGRGSRSAGRFALSGLWSDLAQSGAFHGAAAPAVLRKTRNVAMIGDLNLPQCRKYRVEQMDEIWGAEGASYRFAHYEDVPRCLDILQTASHLTLYRLGRGDLLTMYLYEARRLGLPVLYDIDDPLFSVAAYQTYSNMSVVPSALKDHFLAEAPLYAEAMNLADIVSVSTPGLAEHAALHSARPTLVRRNFADRATLEAGKRAMACASRDAEAFTVAVASGSKGHEADFALIRESIASFLAASKNRRLLVLGHLDMEDWDGLQGQIETHPFRNYDEYLEVLARADCAVMPLTDDLFNQCKSAVRVVDAFAAGVPAVVSNVGDLAAPIEVCRSGYVVEGPEGWCRALDRMASDRKATAKMRCAARQDIESRWSARVDWPVVDPELGHWLWG
ncbi:MAG: glycosyltransferase [Pseudomonadota bacterium]